MPEPRSSTASQPPLVLSRAELQELEPMPALQRHPFAAAVWLLRTGFGIVVLIALLAIASAIPLVNVLALGYLMEIQGRAARTGKLRSGVYLVPLARRLGALLLGIWVFLLPIQLFAGLARDSWLLAGDGAAVWWWNGMLGLVSVLVATHLVMTIGCGAAWWRFFRPLSNARWLRAQLRGGEYWRDADRTIREFLAAFQFARLLRLGLLSYMAVYFWLVVPTLLFTMLDDVTAGWQRFGFVVGSVTLTLTLTWLPLMLAHVAAEARLGAMFELRTVLQLAARTPFCWALATAILLACSVLPLLYTALFKIQIPPHDARWDLMLVFLVTAIPARVLLGWVYHRGRQQPPHSAESNSVAHRLPGRNWAGRRWAGRRWAGRRWAGRRWAGRIWQALNASALCIGVGYYVYFLYMAQTGGELGQRAIWQYHALLQPLPF